MLAQHGRAPESLSSHPRRTPPRATGIEARPESVSGLGLEVGLALDIAHSRHDVFSREPALPHAGFSVDRECCRTRWSSD
jgi:hypothetical protein